MSKGDPGVALEPTLGAAETLGDDDGPVARGAALQIGTRLGSRYEIRGYLGEGGMGAVYRAFDEVLAIEVALKSVRGSFATDAHLREEVRVAQRITHPNVCRIYDLVDVEGRHFIKMEYIAGETLAAKIARGGKLSIVESVRIARGVAEGLAAAHDKSIIHRDLKPSNVMLADQRIVLMDFGLARAIAEAAAHDRAGTPSYMSPEQLAGKELDTSSDLFALGCLLYEMLAGKRAFDHTSGTYTELASARSASASLSELPSVRDDIPRWLARATIELLADDRATRRAGLARLLRGPRRGLAIFGVAIGALAIGALVWWLVRPPPPWRAKFGDIHEYTGNADLPSITADGSTLLMSQDPENAGRWGIYELTLPDGTPRLISPEGVHCGWARWSRDQRSVLGSCVLDGEDRIVRIPRGGGAPHDLGPGTIVDDCGDVLAIVVHARMRSTAFLQRPDGTRDEIVSGNLFTIARCSPAGTHVALIRTYPNMREVGDIVLFDRATKTGVAVAKNAIDLTFVRDERIVFSEARASDGKMTLVELDLATRAKTYLAPGELNIRAPDIAADKRRFVFHRDQTWLSISELTSRGERRVRTIEREMFGGMVPVPGMHALVAMRLRGDSTVIAIDLATQVVRELAPGHAPFPSRDGTHVFFGSLDDRRQLRAIPFEGGIARDVARLPGVFEVGLDSLDGTQVIVRDTEGRRSAFVVTERGVERASVDGLVLTSPGGWRAIWSARPNDELAVVAPGSPLTTTKQRLAVYGRPAWVGDSRLSYCDLETCKIMDVDTNAVEEGPRNPTRPPNALAAGLDGKGWFFIQPVAHVTLHELTNYRDR